MGDAKNDLWFVIGMLLILAFVWFATGGPTRTGDDEGFFTFAPSVPFVDRDDRTSSGGDRDQIRRATDIEREFNRIKTEIERVQGLLSTSITVGEPSAFIGLVSIQQSTAGPRAKTPEKEYVELTVARSANSSINLTGWVLESLVTGKRVVIGQGARLPRAGQINVERDIIASANDRLFITTGRSPIGTSFRTNACTGYLEQFQDFEPPLTRACPAPDDDLEVFAEPEARVDSACTAFVDRLSRCTTPLSGIPIDVGNACRSFIANDLTYNGCVENHRNDNDFFGSQWRIFLGRSSELWKDGGEVIRLLDADGKTVDVFSY